MTFIQVADMLRRYFAEHNISTDKLTVVLNFGDSESGAKIDAALNREFAESYPVTGYSCVPSANVTTRFSSTHDWDAMDFKPGDRSPGGSDF